MGRGQQKEGDREGGKGGREKKGQDENGFHRWI